MVVRIAGINLPTQKHVHVALRAICGIGKTLALKVCKAADVDPAIKLGSISESELERLRQEVAQYTVEGDLRRARSMDIKRKMDLGCYAGMRHRRGLPVHGQRTRTNARTRKGKRKAVRG